MAKDWIKKAIKHPGRCTPGSPNYDCPKGSPQWNLAQRFKHGDLHKKEDGGQIEKVSNLEFSSPYQSYTDPHPKVLEDFKKNYYDSLDGEYSIFDNDKYYVYDGSKPTKVKVGKQFINLKEGDEEYEKAKKLLEDDAESSAKSEYFGTIYDKLSDIPDNYTPPKDFSSFLENLRNESKERIDFYNDTDAYARYVDNGATSEKVNEYINKFGAYKPIQVRDFLFQNRNKFRNGGYATSDNIDIDYYTNPIKYFAAKGANIPTSWDNYRTKLNSKEESKFLKWRSTLPENLQNENDYDLRGYYKEYGNKPIPKGIEPHLTDEFKLPNHPTFSQNSRYYNDETSYLGGKWENGSLNWIYVPNSNLKNRLFEQKSMDEVRSDFLNQNHNMLSRSPNMFKKFGGYAEMGFDTNDYYSAIANERPRDSATSYQQDVKGKFNWLNTLAKTPIEQIQKDIDSIPLTKNYMLNKTPKGYFNVYDKNNKPVGYSIDGKTLVPQEPNFEDGGLVRAWIQKFMKGGYIAEDGYPNAQELTQPTTNYYNWGNYNNSFSDPTALNQNPFDVNKQQMQVPMAQSNMPQNIGTNYKMDFNASNDEVNKGNAMADSMMGGKKGTGISNPMSMGMDVAGKSMNAAANLMSTFGKDNSKAKAFGLGASGAMKVSDNITKPFESIPIAGKAISAVGKTLGFIIGGALEARRQGIENEEMDKYNKIQEYTSRNSQAIQQPSYYGQTHSKYGSNIKNLEQRIMDDIYSDFDKYMKLT